MGEFDRRLREYIDDGVDTEPDADSDDVAAGAHDAT